MTATSPEKALRIAAGWRRQIAECPHCATCRKEIASLLGVIPPRLVRRTDGEWEHITAEAIAAFYDVFNRHSLLAVEED
jgi:hypothetical protein